jgi:hypothetical protein
MLDGDMPEGLMVDSEDMMGTSQTAVGAIDLQEVKKSKNKQKAADLSAEFGFNNA